MNEYIDKQIFLAKDYLETGILQNDANMVLTAKEVLRRNLPLVASKDKQEVLDKYIRACTSLCILHSSHALQYLQEAYKVAPENPDVLNNFGYIYHKSHSNYEQSIEYYDKCLLADPKYETAYLGIIEVYRDLRLHSIELSYCKKGISNIETSPFLWNSYGLALLHTDENVSKVQEVFIKTLDLANKYSYESLEKMQGIKAKIYVNLGHTYGLIGEFKKAILCYIDSLRHDETHTNAYQNILLNLHFYTNQDFYKKDNSLMQLIMFFNVHINKKIDTEICTIISKLHIILSKKLYGNITPEKERQIQPKENGRINIGYVGFDLFDHAVSFFIQPLFHNINEEMFSIFVYSNNIYNESQIKSLPCSKYRTIRQLSAKEVFSCIKEDKIDILVDLSGYTSGNRLDVFALNPAPICLSYVAYPNNLGLEHIKRISDVYSELYNPETNLIKLNRLFLSYTPNDVMKSINIKKKSYSDDQLANKEIVFGCFAKLQKINDEVISTFKDILSNCPESKLILKSKYFQDPIVNKNWKEKFGEFQDRVLLLKGTKTTKEHLEMFSMLDILLDTFYYSGTTISSEALYMNIPIISMAPGNRKQSCGHVSRVTGSILNSMNLSTLCVARDREDYKRKAINLIQYLPKLNIREKFLSSPISNGRDLIQHLEKKYLELYLEKDSN